MYIIIQLFRLQKKYNCGHCFMCKQIETYQQDFEQEKKDKEKIQENVTLREQRIGDHQMVIRRLHEEVVE